VCVCVCARVCRPKFLADILLCRFCEQISREKTERERARATRNDQPTACACARERDLSLSVFFVKFSFLYETPEKEKTGQLEKWVCEQRGLSQTLGCKEGARRRRRRRRSPSPHGDGHARCLLSCVACDATAEEEEACRGESEFASEFASERRGSEWLASCDNLHVFHALLLRVSPSQIQSVPKNHTVSRAVQKRCQERAGLFTQATIMIRVP
jgi:hypothetical protein